MTEIQAFAREFLRDPLNVAALVPSFAPLCRQAAAPLPETGDPVVLDLGAGTGKGTRTLDTWAMGAEGGKPAGLVVGWSPATGRGTPARPRLSRAAIRADLGDSARGEVVPAPRFVDQRVTTSGHLGVGRVCP